MSEMDPIPLHSGDRGEDGARLILSGRPGPDRPQARRRAAGHTQDGPPVLLLHGASANRASFTYTPSGHPRARSLVDYLIEEGFDPWLLDWRGSGLVVDATGRRKLRGCFDLDHAAACDIPAALARIQHITKKPVVGVVGHCMGAAILAQAVAGGYIRGTGVEHIVLLALGLFYEPAWDGRLKGQDYALDRAWAATLESVIDPRPGGRWPAEIEEIYANWPSSLRPHPSPGSEAEELCNRISFMYGPPYREAQLGSEVHEGDFLRSQFGAIPLRMYVHAAQNIRRGWAGPFNGENDDFRLIEPEARDHFLALESVTLITGAQNQLWHRDSIDRMYEWLKRGGTRDGHCRIEKAVIPDYGHQDLFWGTRARDDVFERILAGLPPRPPDFTRAGTIAAMLPGSAARSER